MRILIALCLILVLSGCGKKTKTYIVESDNTVRKVIDEKPIKNEALVLEGPNKGKVEERFDVLMGYYILNPFTYHRLLKAAQEQADKANNK